MLRYQSNSFSSSFNWWKTEGGNRRSTGRQVNCSKATPSSGCCPSPAPPPSSFAASGIKGVSTEVKLTQQQKLDQEQSLNSTFDFDISGMERGLILIVAALAVFVAPVVQGTAHLSFSNATVNITRDGCAVTKLCVETPDDCDPAGNDTCLFSSVMASSPMAPNGTTLAIELRGNSMGYVALGLTMNASMGATMLFICAQDTSANNSFFFRTMQRNNSNDELTPTETIVREIRGSVKDNVIQCEFEVPNVNATNMRNSHATTFSILLGNGTTNGTTVGMFMRTLDSGPLNVADPTSTEPTPAPTTTPAPITTPAPALTFSNATVNITRDGCTVTKVCVETPTDCNPAGNGTCLFGSVNASRPMAPNGSNLTIQLRGNSMGYVALGLTMNASMGTSMLFLCGQNASANNTFFFSTMQRNNSNNELTPVEKAVKEVRGSVQGNVIRCEFVVLNVNATNMRNSDATTFVILLGNGTVNGSMIGNFSLSHASDPLNVANPSNPQPSGAGRLLHSHALLLLLSVLTLVKLIA